MLLYFTPHFDNYHVTTGVKGQQKAITTSVCRTLNECIRFDNYKVDEMISSGYSLRFPPILSLCTILEQYSENIIQGCSIFVQNAIFPISLIAYL